MHRDWRYTRVNEDRAARQACRKVPIVHIPIILCTPLSARLAGARRILYRLSKLGIVRTAKFKYLLFRKRAVFDRNSWHGGPVSRPIPRDSSCLQVAPAEDVNLSIDRESFGHRGPTIVSQSERTSERSRSRSRSCSRSRSRARILPANDFIVSSRSSRNRLNFCRDFLDSSPRSRRFSGFSEQTRPAVGRRRAFVSHGKLKVQSFSLSLSLVFTRLFSRLSNTGAHR